MYSKTSIRHRLGPLTGLWVLHTTVQGRTDTCYFFRMAELFFQAKTGVLNGRRYLCQVEELPEDVEALELPVPAGTPVQAVLLVDGADGGASLDLLVEGGSYLRFALDDDDIGIRMETCRDGSSHDPASTREVEICGFDTPAIPLPENVARSRRSVMVAGLVSTFVATPVLGLALQGSGLDWICCVTMLAGLFLVYASARLPWRFVCPYCGKSTMRPDGSISNYLCPRCGNTCRSGRQ